jgi:hypothetical protein
MVEKDLDDLAHIAGFLAAYCAIKRSVPQAACPDGTMKAATCVPTFQARAAFYFQSNTFSQ